MVSLGLWRFSWQLWVQLTNILSRKGPQTSMSCQQPSGLQPGDSIHALCFALGFRLGQFDASESEVDPWWSFRLPKTAYGLDIPSTDPCQRDPVPPRIFHPIFAGVLGSWLALALWAQQDETRSFRDVLVTYSSPGGAGPLMSMLLMPGEWSLIFSEDEWVGVQRWWACKLLGFGACMKSVFKS